MHEQFKKMDTQELEFPNTVFVRDIESRVFQSIAAKCISDIEGIAFVGGNILDNLFGRDTGERIKGISAEQDQKNHSVTIKIEVNVAYGISMPEKAEEIQSKITREITRLTGIHVGCVHVVFKNLITEKPLAPLIDTQEEESVEKIDDPLLEYSENL